MFKVNNKKTISKLATSSFKASKMRNIFAVVAIILTTVLFTGLFTIASSLIASMEESSMRQVGGNSHGSFKYLTREQYEKISVHPSIKEVSYTVVMGVGENKELAKRPTELRYANDEAVAGMFFSLPTTGRLPEKNDELATDTLVLERLGIKPELGQKVTLEYSISGKKYQDSFTLVGFWQGDKLMPASQIWLNRGFVEMRLENYVPEHGKDMIGRLNADVNFANTFNLEGKMVTVLMDTGYSPNDIDFGVNWAYTGNNDSVDMGTMIGAVGAVLMIILCGYLIISNIFYISVAKDIRFYGLLKTIGTTGKQIKYLIRKQVLLLCVIGVPLGIIAGYFAGAMLTPMILSIINTNVIKISVSPIAFILSAVFAILTVFISVASPSKIAARVSPIEALRSTDGVQKSKKTSKKSSGINLLSMAQSNVFRNKKKALLVVISLSLSMIILNCAYSMANSFDMDKYLQNMIGSDYAVGDVSNFNVHIYYSNEDTLSPEFLAELGSQRGIESVNNIYFDEPLNDIDPRLNNIADRVEKEFGLSGQWLQMIKDTINMNNYLQHIYGLDEKTMGKLEVHSGSIDMEKLRTGKYVIISSYDDEGRLNYFNVGEKVSIKNEAGKVTEYEVLAVANIPSNIDVGHSHPITPEFFLPSEIFLRDIKDKAPMLTTVDVEDSFEDEVDSFISNYCENVDQNMQYRSKAIFVKEYENTQNTYKSVGLVLSLLVAFIGIMNFINTIVTSIISRKRELAMLQSIGLTNTQTAKMLIYEGTVYTVLTAIFALTIGSAIGYMAISEITGGGLYTSTYFTVLPSIICLPILGFISMIVPYISEKVMHKNSVVERLREAE